MSIRYQCLKKDGAARLGILLTPHGAVETPAFMPVGTVGTVKGIYPGQVDDSGSRILLANTYHLALRPGDERVARLGGLHAFMNWPHAILTDSGGYQVFSLAQRRTLTDAGVLFRSHLDGSQIDLTPERAVQIQENLGSDIAMVLDICPPAGCSGEEMAEAIRRTLLWAKRCQNAATRADQALFAIVQGGLDLEARQACAAALVAMDFPGYALGGFSVGEAPEAMAQALPFCAACLPASKPRYLMGVGRPQDLIAGMAAGIDMFDCVLPTRNGRNASAYTRHGEVRLRNACHRDDPNPLEAGCLCPCCTGYSRAYLHHLFAAEEMLGPMLLSLHNLWLYQRLMSEGRAAIGRGEFGQWSTEWLVCLDGTP